MKKALAGCLAEMGTREEVRKYSIPKGFFIFIVMCIHRFIIINIDLV